MSEPPCPSYFWAALAVLVMALMGSLVMNIVYCKEKQRRAKQQRYFEEYSPSYEQYYIENNPIYGNLNQEFIDILDESYYEQMKAQHPRPANLKVSPENQTCYASLALETKKPRKHRKKKAQALDHLDVPGEEQMQSKSNTPVSRSSIYINSEQLTAETNTAEQEAIHDDPIRLYNLIHNKREDTSVNITVLPNDQTG
ncbi:T-cell receptor-associated transmembrane adapter 1 [Microcaecilia unicolor]|uniref:T-cell receptor-associated transmembrane adapter 1 n=1 Tax=Microcaecilia unicolor TaxID=1415580 RepID=UPI001186E2E5|nr:T-cell receptor-associated transmembrane adapter 1 [Microcaecilia unicolor]